MGKNLNTTNLSTGNLYLGFGQQLVQHIRIPVSVLGNVFVCGDFALKRYFFFNCGTLREAAKPACNLM